MENNNRLHNRKPNRLSYYDYSKCGSYFITICTANHKNTLCSIYDSDTPLQPVVTLTQLGQIVQQTLESQKLAHIFLQKYVIMPNHIHLLLYADGHYDTMRLSVSDFAGHFKSIVANRWLSVYKSQGRQMGTVWQRSFHDRIIRNQQEFDRIWLYIEANPARWQEDCFHQ